MADGGDEQDKSEEATPFKLSKAREKGSVARGTDLSFLASLVAFAGFLIVAGEAMLSGLMQMMRQTLALGIVSAADPRAAIGIAGEAYSSITRPLILLGATVLSIVALCEIIQLRGFVVSAQPLVPDFTRLNPAKGLKRMFSMRLLKQALKSIIKLLVYTTGAILIARSAITALGPTIADATTLAGALHVSAMRMLWVFVFVALLVAAIDQVIARGEFRKQMRMSRREVTREAKDREGDPRLRHKRKQLHAEFAQRSASLGALPGSDMLIVNPEHFAVALGYDRTTSAAPVVRAKARNLHALAMKRRATQLDIPVFEMPPLARALFADTDAGAEIGTDHYHAVAALYFKIAAADGDRGDRT